MLTFNTEILEKKMITDDVVKLTIAVPSEFSYEPGQFVTFMIEKKGERKPRSYSILSSSEKKVSFIIRLIEGGFAGGKFKECKVGDKFEVRGPLGHFTFDEISENKEHWFLGCGCGLAPLYSMIKANVKGSDKKFVLVVSYKNVKGLLMHEELKKMAEDNSNFVYLPTITREEWERTGRVQKHLPDNAKEKSFYICGLKELVVDVKQFLLDKEAKPEDIKFERYS